MFKAKKPAHVNSRYRPRSEVPRHAQGEAFLKGPIPWAWLSRASSLPGKALHVGVALWFAAGKEQTGIIAINLSRLALEFGFDRSAASRGLDFLALAGLVAVDRHPGRKPVVTLIAVHRGQGSTSTLAG